MADDPKKTFHAAVAIGAALVVGVASGAAAGSAPTIRAPHDCTVALNLAERTSIAQDNAITAVHLRATRGKSEFARHDAELTRLLDEVDTIRPDYIDAKASCLGDS